MIATLSMLKTGGKILIVYVGLNHALAELMLNFGKLKIT